MKRIAMVGILMATLVAGTIVAAPAWGGHAPTSYCSESGDVCNSTRKVDGKRLLRIVTAAKYFGRYRVCVTAPDDSRACRRGRMRDPDGDGTWVGRMDWRKRFPYKGPGAYDVRWSAANGYKSPKLGFHVKP